MEYKPPTFFGLAYSSRLFCETDASGSLAKFRERTEPALDLRKPERRLGLLKWLNERGCRINEKLFPDISKRLAELFPEHGTKRDPNPLKT